MASEKRNPARTFWSAALAGGVSLSLCVPVMAKPAPLPAKGPLPQERPSASVPKPAPAPFNKADLSPAATAPGAGRHTVSVSPGLKSGLDALRKGQTASIIAIRNALPLHSLDRKTLTWAIAVSGAKDLPSAEIRKAIDELPGWPGKALMQANFEQALARENHAPQDIIALFARNRPQTAYGMIILGNALVQTGRDRQAHMIIAPWWHKTRLTASEEQRVLDKLGNILTVKDHQIRLKAMLYARQFNAAERLIRHADAYSLYHGFVAVARNQPNAAQKLAAVDKSWRRDPAFLFARIQYLRRTGHYANAAKLMLQAPRDAASLIDPDCWWVERRVLSRELLDAGNPKLAYRVAAIPTTESRFTVDAEFHAGWYALRFLNKPKIALRHFAHIPQHSANAISTARGFYWMGRAAETLHEQDKAVKYFRRAAHYGTTFYGQLAASRLELKMPEVPYPTPSADERRHFARREPVQAIRNLEAAGYNDHAAILYRTLSQELKSPGELALLAAIAERRNDHYTSLRIGKNAALRGLDVGSLSHPLGAIPESANISSAGKALAYAIARQESEFNPRAVSGAGARGMLQLMPGTAKSIALRRGMPYSVEKLSSDVAYNATLGAHFLGDQLSRFDGSYILTFIGYNAGAGRASEWIARYGDPRGYPVDAAVDWIERIPYTETRNYVQRVMENYQVYKARLTGKTDIATDLVTGRRNAAR